MTVVEMKLHKVHFDNSEGKPLHNRTLSVAVDDEVTASFFGLLSTGYSWVNRTEPKHMKLKGSLKQEVPPNNFVWNYTATSTGTDVLVFTDGQPWASTPADIVTLTVKVGDTVPIE